MGRPEGLACHCQLRRHLLQPLSQQHCQAVAVLLLLLPGCMRRWLACAEAVALWHGHACNLQGSAALRSALTCRLAGRLPLLQERQAVLALLFEQANLFRRARQLAGVRSQPSDQLLARGSSG